MHDREKCEYDEKNIRNYDQEIKNKVVCDKNEDDYNESVLIYYFITMKATYIDAYVLVIKKDKVAAYKKMAEDGVKMWMKHGALSYRECMGDDITPKTEG